MIFQRIGLFLGLLVCWNSVVAQTFIGEILYRNQYEYIKLVCEKDSCIFSMPYRDGNQRSVIHENVLQTDKWTLERGVETWHFTTQLEKDKLIGKVELPMGKQKMLLVEQKSSIPETELEQYLGSYADEAGRRAIVYQVSDRLQIMSPYSEESMSLKPIAAQTFWSVSGEQSQFSTVEHQEYQMLTISDRFGNSHILQKQPPIKIEEVWLAVGEDTLYGELYLPESNKKVPACIVLPGGGSVGIDNYRYEARFFAAYGMASLIFNKSGEGKSKGSGSFQRQTFEEKTEQYIQIFKYLKNRPETDPQRIGVHGPSEGGRLALMMAIDLKDEIAFANAVAGPLMTMREGQLYAMDHYHRNLGLSEEANLAIAAIWQDYYGGIIAGEIDTSIIRRANEWRTTYQRAFLPPDGTALPISPQAEDLVNDRVVKEASVIECPVLLQYGENDQRVHPQKSLQNFYAKIRKDLDVTTILYPRGNHSFMTPEFEICAGYLDDKMKWLKKIGIVR